MSSLSALLSEAEALRPEQLQRLIYEAQWLTRRDTENEHWRQLCDLGERHDIVAAGQDYAGIHAVGIASDYDRVPYCQEIVAWAVGGHPRRPVLMPGSKSALCYRYGLTESGNPNGFAAALFWRYFRMKRVTAFSEEEVPMTVEWIRRQIAIRFPSVTHSYWQRTITRWTFRDRGGCYINGKARSLNASEFAHLRALYAIIRKTVELEVRLESARTLWRERMA